jgi:hypothetical protein
MEPSEMAPKKKRKLLVLPYFEGKPAQFRDTADIEILLDSGDLLPVHSMHLAEHSSVLCDIILTDGSGSDGKIRPKEDLQLPLPDTTFSEACDFLAILYNYDRQESISANTLPSILKIAYKFDMPKVLDSCDKRMASMASFKGKSKISLWVMLSLFKPHSYFWHTALQCNFLPPAV